MTEQRLQVPALDLRRVLDLEYSALQLLVEGEKQLAESGVQDCLAAPNPAALDMARHVGLDQRLGRERLLFSAREAIPRFHAR